MSIANIALVVFILAKFKLSLYADAAPGCFSNTVEFKLCTNTADIILIIDLSNKISQNEFDALKFKLIDFIDSLDIDGDKINLSILTFGDRIRQLHPMTSNKFEKQLIKNKMNDLELSRDAGLTTKTLSFARMIFQFSSRANIPKITVLFSTGLYRDNEFLIIRKEANQLKMLSHLITVDVLGNGVTNRNLRMIATCPSYFVRFDSLLNLVKNISAKDCVSLLKFYQEKFFDLNFR